MALEARKSKIKVLADLVYGEGTSCFVAGHLVVSSHGREGRKREREKAPLRLFS